MCLSFFLMSILSSYAANKENWYFTHFTSSDSGLSFNNINCIDQDSRGFIWLATEDGLNRFDGKTFVCYYKNELGVNTDFITALCHDNNGNMWIGTDGGATFYDYLQDRFIPLKQMSDKGTVINSKVTHIAIDKEGIIWMSVNGLGFFSYNPKTKKLVNYFSKEGHTSLPVNIRTFIIDNNNDFWFSLYFSDLWHSDRTLRTIEPVSFLGWKSNDDIMSIERDPSNNTFYLAGWQNGLCEADFRKHTFETIIANKNNYRPMGMFLDRDKRIWMATTMGLYMYDTISGTTSYFTPNPQDKFALSDENVMSVFMDNSDGLWVSTLSSGLNYCAGFYKNFEKYNMVDGKSLYGSFIMDLDDNKAGKIWAVSEKEGLMFLDIKSNQLHSYSSSRLPKSFFSICCDSNLIWLGSWTGVYKLNPSTGDIKVYNRIQGNYEMKDNKIHKIFKTSSKDILVGSTLGMMKYDSQLDAFVNLDAFDGIYVTGITETVGGDLWISSYANGIFKYNLRKNKILEHYGYAEKGNRHIPVDKIMSVYLDEDGVLWAGTYGAGIMKYDSAKKVFNTFEKYRLKNNRIAFSMVQDEDGRMWVATSKGLISLKEPLDDVRYYTVLDGLLDEMIDGHNGIKTKDGNIYFSSHNGIIRFNPRMFQSDNKIPPLVLTAFIVNGKLIKPGEGLPISININETTNISLAHNQNSFGFGMSLLGLASPASNQIYYKLSGYDSDWKKLDGNVVSYTNVPAGKYKLYVKGINSNGIWNDSHLPISITVKKVFYKTNIAFLVYILLLIGMVLPQIS